MRDPTDRRPANGRNLRELPGGREQWRAGDGGCPPAEAVAERWARTRTFHHSRYTAERIARERTMSVSVCVPAKECAGTVGRVAAELVGLRERGAIDEVVVVDAASRDGTAAVARRAGARVLQEAELMPRFGEVLGKGDAMWRALSATEGEVVCYLDADTDAFDSHFATGVIGSLVCEQGVEFVKGFYRRPLAHGEMRVPDGGGRVNHLTARPALALFYPELAAVRQPLAGEVAARRELLERLPFATGYAVEIAMLIDVWREVGLAGIAQVDLEEHRNRSQPLQALVPMAHTVLATIARRLQREGRLVEPPVGEQAAVAVDTREPDADGVDADERRAPERPPLASVRVA
ncbi:MAG TPA: glucosyl-3-phosphoglycerate synthase [Solirubrobacteraceae bacterium]|jgi:glucosyl-3-phosphoglycerate synthase|nr:glucosyl-3-phosphoglycerate synthase [Solirubrobacteraceae bacterium]